ncbi:MAG: S9 family peptidase [Chitinophagaceae bacterium]|nr:S9 family peptidase [Chitinophagaceae bacterium]MCW5905281.1 S9 family peptidase [Chitinophagaceae bacterium]
MKIFCKKLVWFLLFVVVNNSVIAQDAIDYQMPPKEIADLLLAKPTPTVSIDSKGDWMLLCERSSYPSVEELGQPEIRVAGLRINPNNYSLSRQNYFNLLTLKNIKTKKEHRIVGLPINLQASNIQWSPNEKKIAFTNTTNNSVDVYVISLTTFTATKVNKQPLNIIIGGTYSWHGDDALMYKIAIAPASSKPKQPIKPKGPSIQENVGKTAPGRTYQDLIKTPYDEKLFEFMTKAQLVLNTNGIETPIGKPAIYKTFAASPNRAYILVETINKPFSYLVPANGFASTVSITDMKGNVVKLMAELPSAETRPTGRDNVQNIPRNFSWRDDEAADLTWCEPLDSGLIKNKVDYHDAVYALAAPFKGERRELFKTTMRYRYTIWGNNSFAWVVEGLSGKQITRVNQYSFPEKHLDKIFERNTTDAYNNPGNPVTTKNVYGKEVINIINNTFLLNNRTGSSPNGDLPFISLYDINAKKSNIIWRCQEGSFEYVVEVIDPNNFTVITRKETKKDVPNYFLKSIKGSGGNEALTSFTNPYPSLQGIKSEKIRYTRFDGIELTGNLYLPKGYTENTGELLPLLIWAYPREYNNASDAGQIRGSQNKFTTISWASPLYYVTQGFAVLDNAEMPIVSTDETKKPNDNFIEQLQMNAEAAIDYLVNAGIVDRNKVAIGGHSYGAFMTANLLAHTSLFKAGIARSGAYNRTLTPFGFQNEDRTYWQAPQLYYEMSPFSYANKIKTPLLLIHGEIDENPGTFPINSERLYNAIKGHGGTVRYVSLPYEGHSYRAKENLLHMLWEQNEWLKKFVKEAKE